MKRLLICLVLLMLPCAALANSWGAPGGTPELFEHDADYAEYFCIADDYSATGATAQLIMSSRYHNQLICAEKVDGHWLMTETSTKAVYQPGENNADKAELTRTESGFMLIYPDEQYEFVYENEQWSLQYAWVNGLTFTPTVGGMLVTKGESSRVWRLVNSELLLQDFNISLFPRSLFEVERLNHLWAVIAGDFWLDYASQSHAADLTLPVYSAPSEDSWRAADGKASVSLRDAKGLYTFGMVDDWQLIEYRISLRASRVGYIHGVEEEFVNWPLAPTAVTALSSTWLTDDPNVSQRRQMTIPANTELTALNVLAPFYAYVETTLNGQAIRGFVPLADLYPAEDSIAFDSLSGAWVDPSLCIVFSDVGGRFSIYELTQPATTVTGDMLTRLSGGSWIVRPCDPERYFYGETLSLTLLFEDGTAACFGLNQNGDLLELDDQEGFWVLQRAEAGQEEIERDMMARIAGTYDLAHGLWYAGETLTLYPDGTAESATYGWWYGGSNQGTWFVTAFNPVEAYSYGNPEYAIHILLDNGTSIVQGCAYQWYEDEEQKPVVALELDNCGYIRNDVEAGMIAGISGSYVQSSGTALLMDYCRLIPDGTLMIGDDGLATVGFWVPSAEGESSALTNITCYFSADSPIHPGETVRFDCTYAPATDTHDATLTFFLDGQESGYTRYESPGYN